MSRPANPSVASAVRDAIRPLSFALGILTWSVAACSRAPQEARAAAPEEDAAFTLYVLGGSTAWGEPYSPRADGSHQTGRA